MYAAALVGEADTCTLILGCLGDASVAGRFAGFVRPLAHPVKLPCGLLCLERLVSVPHLKLSLLELLRHILRWVSTADIQKTVIGFVTRAEVAGPVDVARNSLLLAQLWLVQSSAEVLRLVAGVIQGLAHVLVEEVVEDGVHLLATV